MDKKEEYERIAGEARVDPAKSSLIIEDFDDDPDFWFATEENQETATADTEEGKETEGTATEPLFPEMEEVQLEAEKALEEEASAPKTEEVRAEAGEAPGEEASAPEIEEVQLEAEKTPEVEALARKTEEVRAEAGEAPEEEASAPEIEEVQLEAEETPEEETSAPKTEEVQLEAEETPEEETPESPVRKKRLWMPLAAAAAILLICVYGLLGLRYRNRFFPRTTINGTDVSGQTIPEAEKRLNDSLGSYTLHIRARAYPECVLTAEMVGLQFTSGARLREMVSGQSPLAWGLHLLRPTSYETDMLTDVDEDAVRQVFRTLPFLDVSTFRKAGHAAISNYVEGEGFSVIPGEKGTELDCEKAESAIVTAIRELRTTLDLEEVGVYDDTDQTAEIAAQQLACDEMNRYIRTEVNYAGGKGMILNGNVIREWLQVGENGSVSLNDEKLRAYVGELASRYDTWNKAKALKTSWGQTVTVKGGSYGWKVDQNRELAWLQENLASGGQFSRMPIFAKEAVSLSEPDYGDSYVEINLTAQHLYLYKSGKQILSTDLVSGNVARGTVTHTGVFQITYKQKNATLRGENYAAPVKYWMPFNGGEGLHDAPWRGSFGGSIYKTGGSHGCVNLPSSAAKTLFDNVSAGTPVIVYTLAGTEGVKRSVPGGNASVPATTAAPTAAAASQAAESTASAAETGTASPETERPAGPGGSSAPIGPGIPRSPSGHADSEKASPGSEIGPGVPRNPGGHTDAGNVSSDSEIGPGVPRETESAAPAAPEASSSAVVQPVSNEAENSGTAPVGPGV